MVSERLGHSRGWDGQRHIGQTSSSSQTYANTAGPDPQGVGLWACGFVGFCFVFLEDFFVCFLAMLRAFGALYHRALQGCLGMEAEAGLGGEPGRGN